MVKILGTKFINNNADQGGGAAIIAEDGITSTLMMEYSDFSGNYAGTHGSAAYINGNITTYITHVSITDNTVKSLFYEFSSYRDQMRSMRLKLIVFYSIQPFLKMKLEFLATMRLST